MKAFSRHVHSVRLASAAALLIALVACAGSQPALQQGNLDLGGGISMTPEGEILGATPARPANFAESDYGGDATPTRIAAPAPARLQPEAIVK